MLIEGLYTVERIEKEDNTVQVTIKIDKENDVFKGHFPGNPVMPGVCMIQIVKELTETLVQKKLFLAVSSNIKFMAIINPEKNATLQLTLVLKEEDGIVKVKNTTSFEDTLALKMNATFKILA